MINRDIHTAMGSGIVAVSLALAGARRVTIANRTAQRAVDLALKVGYDFNDHWGITAGYRTVEGGADVDEVYNFAWLHYAVVSVGLAF